MSAESEADQTGESALPGTLPEELRAELIEFRRDLHMHPELGNQ
jgi:amidohydrolase